MDNGGQWMASLVGFCPEIQGLKILSSLNILEKSFECWFNNNFCSWFWDSLRLKKILIISYLKKLIYWCLIAVRVIFQSVFYYLIVIQAWLVKPLFYYCIGHLSRCYVMAWACRWTRLTLSRTVWACTASGCQPWRAPSCLCPSLSLTSPTHMPRWCCIITG